MFPEVDSILVEVRSGLRSHTLSTGSAAVTVGVARDTGSGVVLVGVVEWVGASVHFILVPSCGVTLEAGSGGSFRIGDVILGEAGFTRFFVGEGADI